MVVRELVPIGNDGKRRVIAVLPYTDKVFGPK